MTEFRVKQSIQVKIILWSGLCLFIAALIIIAYAAISLRKTAIEAAKDRVVAIAESKASFIDAEIEIPLDSARTLAQSFSAIKSRENPIDMNREEANTILKTLLRENPGFLGVYTLWEPNAFDKKDQEYVNTVGNDETGRFIPYWSRNRQGNIELEPLVDYTKEGIGEYYLCPKRSKKECVVGPYSYAVQGEEVLMASQAVPIIRNGIFYGIVGIDRRLDDFQETADALDLYDGAATIAVIGNNGLLVAASGQPELVGQNASLLVENFDTILPRIQQKEQFIEYDEQRNLSVFVPIEFGHTDNPWAISIHVPHENITAAANQLVIQMVAIGIFLTLLALVLLWFVARQISQPVQKITHVAQSVAAGNLDVEATVSSSDETGLLAQVFNTMIHNLRQTVEKEREAQTVAQRNAEEIQEAKERTELIVDDYLAFVERIAEGDLTAQLSLDGHKEDDALMTLGNNLNRMVANLRAITEQVKQAGVNIASASTEILSATTEQASSSAQQSSAITEATATVDEVKSIAQQLAQQAGQVAQDSQAMLNVAQRGTSAVENTIGGMGQIRQQVESIAQTILALSEQTQAIGAITATVSELADQSNMLALNAAIEAARAGEQGKSFAVVAQQVRELAERSKSATAQVQEILNEIQRATNAAVMVTEEGSKGVEEGVKLSTEAGQIIHQIAVEVESGAQSNTQMAAAAHQQTSGMEQMGQAMKSIQQATTQTLASTRQAERAARDLNELAQSLEQAITMYQL